MDDLSFLFPVPEPVTLGTETFQAVCFQLRDLARLQGFVKVLSGDPLDNQRMALVAAKLAAKGDYRAHTDESRAYAAQLRSAIKAVDGWPPLLASPEADRLLLETAAGQVLWLVTLLERSNPPFTIETAGRLLPVITADQWQVLLAVAYADHPAEWLTRLMDPPPRRRGAKKSWGEVIEKLARERGWTYDQIGSLYFSQVMAIVAEGKGRPGEVVRTSQNASWYKVILERRRGLLGGNGHASGL